MLECRARKQPVLVGTVSIEKSEALSALFKKRKVPHQVLNARYHEQEAYIIAQAGRPGAVTIATNMAGRGTDIQLGGNFEMRVRQERGHIEDQAAREAGTATLRQEIDAAREVVRQAGGLFIIGSERHESRRIDNQLRGRSGRQGDPGASKFFVSLEDDLMRIFGSERMDGMLQKLGLKPGEAIIHPWVNKALEKAQEKVEARNYEIRKHLLRFDDVMNDQRKVVYQQRREIMSATDIAATIVDMRHEVVDILVGRTIPPNALPDQWDTTALHADGMRLLNVDLPIAAWAKEEGIGESEIRDRITEAADAKMAQKADHLRRRHHAPGRAQPAAPAPRPDLEGASPVARPSAPGHQSARLCAARSAQRVQARGIPALPGHAPPSARARDERPLPRRAQGHAAGGGIGAASAGAHGRKPRGADAGTGGTRQWRRHGNGDRGRRRALGAHAAQRALPVRLRQEIQALPRPLSPRRQRPRITLWCGRWNFGESYRYLTRMKEPRKARLLK